MNDLKPVAYRMYRLDESVFVANETEAVIMLDHGWIAEPVYAIPPTHRVVSVELLKFALKCMHRDNNQAESFLCKLRGAGTPMPQYLLEEIALTDELRAIIDNKEQP